MSPLQCSCPPGTHGSGFKGLTYKGFGRREVLKGTALGFIAGLVETLTSAGQFAQAATLAGKAPEVDKLTIRIVTDNLVDRFAKPAKIEGVTVERRRSDEKPNQPPHDTPIAEWGLSLFMQSQAGDAERRLLLDFGYSSQALLHNLKILGIDPASLDAMILSHGHFDHFGGLSGFLAETHSKLKSKLPFFVGGEDCFCQRQYGNGGDYGVLDRPGILASGLTLMMAEQPAIAADHAVISGQIPSVTDEKPLRSTKEKTGIVAGFGCDPVKEASEKNTGDFVADDFQHEVATSYVIKGKGLVVLSSCSHRGILNAVRQAQVATGVEKIHAIVGGFHLVAPLTDDYVRHTVQEMKKLQPDCVVAAHCSGETFYDIARQEMPGRVIRAAVGTGITFSA